MKLDFATSIVFGEGSSQEQVKGSCAELLKLKTVDDRLRFLDASPKTSQSRLRLFQLFGEADGKFVENSIPIV